MLRRAAKLYCLAKAQLFQKMMGISLFHSWLAALVVVMIQFQPAAMPAELLEIQEKNGVVMSRFKTKLYHNHPDSGLLMKIVIKLRIPG